MTDQWEAGGFLPPTWHVVSRARTQGPDSWPASTARRQSPHGLVKKSHFLELPMTATLSSTPVRQQIPVPHLGTYRWAIWKAVPMPPLISTLNWSVSMPHKCSNIVTFSILHVVRSDSKVYKAEIKKTILFWCKEKVELHEQFLSLYVLCINLLKSPHLPGFLFSCIYINLSCDAISYTFAELSPSSPHYCMLIRCQAQFCVS